MKAFVPGFPIGAGSSSSGKPYSATDLDLSTFGTFTRASEASRVLGALTDGQTVSVAWSPINSRRIDYSSGAAMYLTEGQRTNQMLSTEPPLNRAGGGWVIGGTAVVPQPDGGAIGGGRVTTASGGTGANWTINPVTPNLDWCAFAYSRSVSGTVSSQAMIGGGTVTAKGSNALTTTWQKFQMNRLPDNAFGQMITWLNDGRDWSGSGGVSAGARDSVFWGLQIEQASFSSSYIRTEGLGYGAATRSPDMLSGSIASIPAKMVNGSWSFTVAPVGASSAMIRDGSTQVLFSFADDYSEHISFVITGGTCVLRVVSGGATKVTSSALTFSANQTLTVTVDGAAGSIAVSGATTGNGTVTGTSWTRTVGSTLYVGSFADGTSHAFAGLWCSGATAATPSTKKVVVFTLGQSNMQQHGHMDRVANYIQEYYPNCKLIDGSVGSTSLYVDWDPSTGSTYAAAKTLWNAAAAADATLTDYTPVIVWCHGEADAANATYAAAYGTKLSAMFTALETDIPQLAGCLKIITRLSVNTTTLYGANATTIGQVRTGQTNYVNADTTKRALIDLDDLTFDATPVANLHFDNASIWTLANREVTAARGLGL